MTIRPKRRKSKDNPYILEHIEITNKYYVSFVDSNNKLQKISITKNIFDIFDRFELDDLKELNEYDRHIEHNEVYEYSLNFKIKNKQTSVEDIIEKKLEIEKLYNAIQNLPNIQQRRLKMYYFDNKSLREIAKIEKCNFTAVKFSIDNAIKNLKKNLRK